MFLMFLLDLPLSLTLIIVSQRMMIINCDSSNSSGDIGTLCEPLKDSLLLLSGSCLHLFRRTVEPLHAYGFTVEPLVKLKLRIRNTHPTSPIIIGRTHYSLSEASCLIDTSSPSPHSHQTHYKSTTIHFQPINEDDVVCCLMAVGYAGVLEGVFKWSLVRLENQPLQSLLATETGIAKRRRSLDTLAYFDSQSPFTNRHPAPVEFLDSCHTEYKRSLRFSREYWLGGIDNV
ncbi:hypothetical protein KC331_g3 [Hortaea werneckii]|nr:hypothetical protein KC331_g3 [Hortaea werneckii]